MKKVLGFAILASLVATPALAGETFVRNEWTDSHSHTTTNLGLTSVTTSTRNEWYDSNADKKYVSIDFNRGGGKGGGKGDASKLAGGGKPGIKKEFTYHSADSSLWGHFTEGITTTVTGTIGTKTHSYSNAHETSSGVR